ncbi:MAG: glycosyltransferase family 2 protein [Granulosicoccaceae bacterium]
MDLSKLDLSDRAMINRALHESTEALQLGVLTYALCKHPDDTFLHSHIGRVYYGLGLMPQAASHLDIAINANSDNPSAYFYRALIHRQQNDLSQCAALLEHTVTLSENADYHVTLIVVLMQLHRFHDAITHSSDGLQTHPKDIRFALAKADALIANKMYDLALSWCNEQDVAGTHPEWPLLRYQIYTALNKDEMAAIEYQENTRRQIHAHADYRNKANQVLDVVTDVTLRKQLIQLWSTKLGKLSSSPLASITKQQLPRVAMSILVRDEADIIAENIRYHAAHGVQHFIVTDNGSVDGTREILAQLQNEYSLDIIDEPSHTIDQDLWVTRMARQLKENADCDWVIHNDADEFWVPDSGSLPEAIQTSLDAQSDVGVLACKRLNMLPDKQQVESPGFVFHDSCFATVKTVALLDGEQPWSKSNNNCVARNVMDKVLTRIEGLGDIQYGNHGAEHTMPKSSCNTITVLHYPVRTYQQFERKVVNYGESLAKNDRFPKNSSEHLRYWYQRYLEGKLKDDYDSITFDRARLKILLKDGYVVKDARVQSHFESELAQVSTG